MERVFVGLLSGAAEDSVLLLARSLLDFIYYVQFQQQMDKTLAAMQDSLNVFHSCKGVVIELGIREHFNIPKIHSLLHYVADGYNTEYPECLHINYAKDAYRASNKRDYVEQMALWLQHQEAIHHKTAYHSWRQLRRTASTGSINGSPGDGVNVSDTGSEMGDRLAVMQSSGRTRYKVMKVPYHRGVSVQELETDYKAPEFLSVLKHFLTSHTTQANIVLPVELDRFNIFSRLYVESMPSVVTGHGSVWQKISARPKVAARGRKASSPARFDTAFVWDEGHQQSFFSARDAIRIAQVRAIFKLPDHLRHYPHPLAYVEWFTSLHHHEPISGQFLVTCSTRNHRHNVSVISIDRFACPCHLQAQCGKHISSDWSSNNILEMYQGNDALLTDLQILTHLSVGRGQRLFSDGNVQKGVELFKEQHVCNEFCKWAGFRLSPFRITID
ncbi:hypothetical protein SCLCIDRAFT_29991 [Scleroderma citrinum Foug A]|uniref:Alpha-type protein kinase domain-containing protein n=1 Tax=Scleroderma citrinum Foug A TaxID=1036808 RepID=A0A0C3DIQ9_9AGAM|nr:hypothetical protein SCLCIDRAFT_29991 [Scleroderma citrinum Foug A]